MGYLFICMKLITQMNKIKLESLHLTHKAVTGRLKHEFFKKNLKKYSTGHVFETLS